MGSRLRAARKRAQIREEEADGIGHLSRWKISSRPEEKGGIKGEKSGAAQSKGGRWGGSKETDIDWEKIH